MRRLTDFAACAGCAGKLPAEALTRLLAHLPRSHDPRLLVGFDTADDAGVYRLTDDLALVQTVDFFAPVVDDARLFGRIAAANALSDVYAMGGVPKTALNLVGYPDEELPDYPWLGDILAGAAEACAEAETVVVGGHSVRTNEILFGLSVTGIVHPDRVYANIGARPGDVLVLTKAIGTGYVTAAAKKNACSPETLANAAASMGQLNRAACEAFLTVGGVHAVTDVTGFGLAGHASEMARDVRIVLEMGRVPVLAGVLEENLMRLRNRAARTNRAYLGDRLRVEGESPVFELAFDPQTSGGLLIAIESERAEALVVAARERGCLATAIIGRVEAGAGVMLC